jgi:DNA-binding Lrp family transcriptional regulator
MTINFTPRQKQVLQYLQENKYSNVEKMSEDLSINIDQMRMSLHRMTDEGVINGYKGVNNHNCKLFTLMSREDLEKIVELRPTPIRNAIKEVLADGIPRTAEQIGKCIGISRKCAGDKLRDMMNNTAVWRVDGVKGEREHYYSDRIFSVADIPEQPPEVKSVEVVPMTRSEAATVRNLKLREKKEKERQKVQANTGPATIVTTLLDPKGGTIRHITFADHWTPKPAQRNSRVAFGDSSLNGIF